MKKITFNDFQRCFFDMLYIWRKEFLRIMRDPGVLVIFFAATLLYPLLYGMIYKHEVVRDIPAAVVDLSYSSLSRRYIRSLDATPELKVSNKCHDLEEAKSLFYKHEIHTIILIPEDFDDQIIQGKQTHVSAYFDMSSFLYYKNAVSAVSFATKDAGAEIQWTNLVNSGLTEQQATLAAAPFRYEGIALFNQGGGFASFLLPAVLILILYQTMMLGINMMSGMDWERNNLKALVPMNSRYHGTIRIVLGKGLCYFTLYVVLTFYVLGFIPRLYNLPHIGHQFNLVLFMLPFLLSSIFLAMTLSVWMRNLESAFLLLLFLTMPLLFLAGASWPQTDIPLFWKIVSYFFPSTHGVQGYIRINTMDADLYEVGKEYLMLWLQTGVYFFTACWVYNRQIKKSVSKNATFSM